MSDVSDTILTAMPPAAQKIYNQAVVEYGDKGYLKAKLLLEQLKRDYPKYAGHKNILQLEKKLKSRIGE